MGNPERPSTQRAARLRRRAAAAGDDTRRFRIPPAQARRRRRSHTVSRVAGQEELPPRAPTHLRTRRELRPVLCHGLVQHALFGLAPHVRVRARVPGTAEADWTTAARPRQRRAELSTEWFQAVERGAGWRAGENRRRSPPSRRRPRARRTAHLLASLTIALRAELAMRAGREPWIACSVGGRASVWRPACATVRDLRQSSATALGKPLRIAYIDAATSGFLGSSCWHAAR
jgi:hypothetical protein